MKQLIALCLVLSIAGIAVATPMLDVYLPDKQSYKTLIEGNFDVTEVGYDYARVVGWEDDLTRLEDSGLNYTVVEANIEEFYRSRLDYELDDMGGYPTHEEISDWFLNFLDTYPEFTAGPDTIGYTLEGRPIWVIKISDNPEEDEDEPEIFLNAAIHAREVITPLILMNFAELLAEGYGENQRSTNLVDSREIFIMPVFNVDGYTYNEERDPNGGGMWRKNKRRVNNQIVGVDLNRNFDFMWGYDNEGSSPDTWEETYRGEEPASEPETQVFMEYVNSRNFVSAINYHSYGNLILFPYGFDVEFTPEDFDIYQVLTEYINEPIGFTAGNTPDILYPVNGDAGDWMEGGADYNIFGFIVEVGTSRQGFWPSTNDIDDLVTEQEEPLLRFCEAGGAPYFLLAPPTPEVTVPDTVSGEFVVTWSVPTDTNGNHPVAYDVVELEHPINDDDAENDDLKIWELDGFLRVSARANSGSFSYYSGMEDAAFQTLSLFEPFMVEQGMYFTFNTWFDIEADWDYAYVQASFNNGPWVNLQGNITTNSDPNGNNRGNGITAHSNDQWIEGEFPLGDHVGETCLVRFAYVTDQRVLGEGFYVDDISPVLGFEQRTIVAEAVEDTFIVMERFVEDVNRTLHYKARSIDGQEDISKWSLSATTIVVDQLESVQSDENELPVEFAVSEPFPNPFNPSTHISVALPEHAALTVTVYDILGRQIDTVLNNQLEAGIHQIQIGSEQWASGVYYIIVKSLSDSRGTQRAVTKAVFLK
ncbi:immune inhibitor A [bacterium]|nr:immune inhibitor A [bacterium]